MTGLGRSGRDGLLEGDGHGRLPIGVARMLRMYVATQCFGLLDKDVENVIYDSQAIQLQHWLVV